MKLSKEHLSLALLHLDFNEENRQKIEYSLKFGFTLDDDLAELLRDACHDYIDENCYDENYELDETGQKLQVLADLIFDKMESDND